MSRQQTNCILAAIVILLATAAGISIFHKSDDPVIRGASVTDNAGPSPPDNHPPGEMAGRLSDLLKMSAEDPQNADIPAEIGNTYYDLGEYDKAVAQYRRSLELRPGNPYVETDLATCLHNLNRHDEALLVLNNVLKYRPDFPQALYNKGIVLIYGKKDVPGGIAVWEELLKQDLDPARKADIEQSIRQYRSSGM